MPKNHASHIHLYATPSLLRRFAAMVYDSLLLIAVSMLYGAIMVGLNVLINGKPETGDRVTWGAFNIIMFVGWLITLVLFFCYFWHRSGQTLGMKTWRIKIVNHHDLSPPSYRQCLLRCICAPISFLCLGAGYWCMYGNAERKTLHDILSKTRTLLMAKEKK